MGFRIAITCCFLLSFLTGNGYAGSVDEDNLPMGFEGRLEKMEKELEYQKNEIQYLKTEIVSKMQEAEDLKSFMKSQKQSFETQIVMFGQTIEALTKASKIQTDKIKSLETELDRMTANQDHDNVLQAINATTMGWTKFGMQKMENKFRNRRLLLHNVEESPVGFTAYLDHNTPNLGINQIIVFNRVLFNEGSAYNNSSGIFVCPADGIYLFYFTVSNHAGHQIVAKLVVNGINYVDAIADSEGGTANTEAQGSNLAILSLKKGSHVSIENYRWGQVQADGGSTDRFNSFSGVRLY